jgi:predicted Fe-Mo cluster-binding NifX family protein
MRLAIPEWHGRVSPVFDVAEHIRLLDLDGEKRGDPFTVRFATMALHERARQIVELDVDVLVCGAISSQMKSLLAGGGIRVIPLVCGDVQQVVEAFCDGTLAEARFAMPGCCGKQRRDRQRHRGRGGHASGDIA